MSNSTNIEHTTYIKVDNTIIATINGYIPCVIGEDISFNIIRQIYKFIKNDTLDFTSYDVLPDGTHKVRYPVTGIIKNIHNIVAIHDDNTVSQVRIILVVLNEESKKRIEYNDAILKQSIKLKENIILE